MVHRSSTSVLYKARSEKIGLVALKRFSVISLTDRRHHESQCKVLYASLKTVQKLIHPNIIKHHHVFMANEKRLIYLVMDYYALGSIWDLLEMEKRPLEEKKVKVWAAQIIGALSYIHHRGMAHRNINLKSILVHSDKVAILSGFEFNCLAFKRSTEIMRTTVTNEDDYQAPELKFPKIWPYEAKAADMYAMGVCLFRMVNYDPPFRIQNNNGEAYKSRQYKYLKAQRAKQYVYNPQYEPLIDDRMKSLIGNLLEPIPGLRFTANEALLHQALAPDRTRFMILNSSSTN